MFCTDISSPLFLIFSDSVPHLLYYSHIPASIISLLVGLYVFINDKRSLSARLLFVISFVFSLWSFFNLIIWTNIDSRIIHATWSIFGILNSLLFVFSLYFIYAFLYKKDVHFKIKIFWLILLSPVFFFVTKSLLGFNLPNCEAIENHIYFNYVFGLELFVSFCILFITISKFIKEKNTENKKQIALLGVGISLFLLSFFTTGYFASLIDNFELEQYGLFGMTIFMAFLAYLIVRFKAFNIKLIATQALVVGLVILIGSQFFFIQNNVNRILTAITLVIAGSMGVAIVRSVKKEIALKEELEIANTNQQSLIHFISHQLKGFFTKSKMIFAGIIEEDFGQTSPTLKEVASEGLKSDDNAVSMIQNILGASNLRKGTTTYEMKNIDLSQIVKKASDAYKMEIESKGLKLVTDIDDSPIMINADEKQISQVIRNLIDNSLKYTPTGFIKISLKTVKDGKKQKALFRLEDSGVGLSEDDKHKLFTEGGRGIDSVKINVNSTGYGLYIVKKIVENHNGRIWAESAGRGKGSSFFVELDVIK